AHATQRPGAHVQRLGQKFECLLRADVDQFGHAVTAAAVLSHATLHPGSPTRGLAFYAGRRSAQTPTAAASTARPQSGRYRSRNSFMAAMKRATSSASL